MTADPKQAPPPPPPPTDQGVRIFTYPKVIFLIPTLVAAIACGIGMMVIRDQTRDPYEILASTAPTASAKLETPKPDAAGAKTAKAETPKSTAATPAPAEAKVKEPPVAHRFGSPQNILAMVFLTVFALNLLTMALDFPRFTVIALVLLCAALGFFVLWLNVYFELLPPLVRVLETVYAVANAAFYFLFASIILFIMVIIWATRYLDYWEILPNEILHNHGPFSDLERYPTFNLKFDKEIPDILEYALLRSGRLVLHVPGQSKAIVLDNVLWINHKEEELKRLMSRMEVRVTTDQNPAGPI